MPGASLLRTMIAAEIEALVTRFVAHVRARALEAVRMPGGHDEPRRQRAQRSRTAGRPTNGEMQVRVLRTITQNPGSRTEQLGRALGLPTKVLGPVIRKLVAEGAVKTKGQRRGMTYYVV